jgi:hypothetical protein
MYDFDTDQQLRLHLVETVLGFGGPQHADKVIGVAAELFGFIKNGLPEPMDRMAAINAEANSRSCV